MDLTPTNGRGEQNVVLSAATRFKRALGSVQQGTTVAKQQPSSTGSFVVSSCLTFSAVPKITSQQEEVRLSNARMLIGTDPPL